MKNKAINEATTAARVFLRRVAELAERRAEENFKGPLTVDNNKVLIDITGCKETAALRRASLELTRALANMRRR